MLERREAVPDSAVGFGRGSLGFPGPYRRRGSLHLHPLPVLRQSGVRGPPRRTPAGQGRALESSEDDRRKEGYQMARGTYELNDAAAMATAHVDRDGRVVLTLTDTVDVVIVHLGERARAAVLDALTPPVLQAGENEAILVATQLRAGMRFQTLGDERWHEVEKVWPADAFGQIVVDKTTPGSLYLDTAEQVLVQVPPCPGSEMFSAADAAYDLLDLASTLRPGGDAA